MEVVASPLPFQHGQGGPKRPYPHSAMLDSGDVGMDIADDGGPVFAHPFKRRRRLSNPDVADMSPNLACSALSPQAPPQKQCPCPGGPFQKRSRTEAYEGAGWGQASAKRAIVEDLKRLVDHQASAINRLKSEKAEIENAISGLKSAHEKTLNENRILKRAVAIQQERQNHAALELDAARRFGCEAEERIRNLEQANSTLRYHLRVQEPCAGNDFLEMDRRPPDVF